MTANPHEPGDQGHAITSVLKEHRKFPPPPAFAAKAQVSGDEAYRTLMTESLAEPERFWAEQARSILKVSAPWSRVLEWHPPHVKWFVGAKLNASVNCLDRHLGTPRANKPAIIWEGEDGRTVTLTYAELHRHVCRFANALRSIGVAKGDRVTIYMPLVPEIAVAMLAVARLGATHNVVFGGFSADAIAERNRDAGATYVITADGGYRRGAIIPLKATVDEALASCPDIKKVVVLRRTGEAVPMTADRDLWWHDLLETPAGQVTECAPEEVDAEHPLFLLYTSGSTGKPKGILHTTAGYLLYTAYTHKLVFDLKDDDVYWCTADVGWVTGHSYVVYGPLMNGATTLLYEGAPNHPDWGRFWSIVARHKVSILYTAPTAIRAFMRQGPEWPARHDLASLRLLGSVGEPINPEAWMWYRDVIGGGRCPVVDTWWQTETGGILISPLPGATTTVPGSAATPLPGILPDIVDKHGRSVPPGQGGFLILRRPWPGMMRTVWGDDERYRKQYWGHIPGVYFTGDGARRDEDGNFWILGRIDDVLNVAGHRLSTMEIESALVSHPRVAEAAVVGAPHEIKGEAIHAFVTLSQGSEPSDELRSELFAHVVHHIGALARPEALRFTEALPKTRSGKIMRRLLRDIAAGREAKGDTTTLEDFSVLAKLRQDDE